MWYDVTYTVRVKLGETTVNHLQQHYTMVKILAAAFGSDKKSSGGVVINDLPPEKAATTLNDFFRSVSG